jgi:YD repeat-containing protein
MNRLLTAAIALPLISSAFGAETITYTYDAKGRLVTVVRTGTVNNGVTATYSHDKSNNRTAVVKTKP